MSRSRGLLFDVILGAAAVAAVGYAIVVRLPRRERLPRETWAQVQRGSTLTPTRGDGPVLVEFVDYQCPFCAHAELHVLTALRDSLPGLRRVVRHFPLDNHPHAVPAAAAAECAGAQTGSIARMHHLLYQVQDSIGLVPWSALAVRAGVRDTSAFRACMASGTTLARIAADRALADSLALDGTPTFFLDRTKVPAVNAEQLRRYLLEHGRS